jgi:hypothetical protein
LGDLLIFDYSVLSFSVACPLISKLVYIKDEPSPQQKKLNRLIDQIEQQKISLAAWQNAQAEIQQHTRQKLLPVYSELHEILFQQLEQLWNMLHSHEFSKADLQQLDEKIAQLAQC